MQVAAEAQVGQVEPHLEVVEEVAELWLGDVTQRQPYLLL